MQYIVDWTDKQGKQWVYLPLVHAEIAESHLAENNFSLAIKSAIKAIELDPRHVNAYWILSDSYQALGNKKKALEFVTEGLRHVPGARALVRRYRELGGSDPMPEPYPRDGRDQPVEPTGEPEAVTPAIDEAPGQVESQETIEPNPVQQTTDAPAMPEKPPGNPYCRFCP
jgi:tetratricopeptide (TPR) repeat protein